MRYGSARGLKHGLTIRRTKPHVSLFCVSLGVLTERQTLCGQNQSWNVGAQGTLWARVVARTTHARGEIFHASLSLSIKDTVGVETIVRSSCLPTAAKQCKRHTFSGHCEAAQGCRPQRRAPTGIIRREINTNEKDHKRIPTKVNLDGSKRNMSRGNSMSDELELSSVLGDTRAYLYSPVGGTYSEPKGNSS